MTRKRNRSHGVNHFTSDYYSREPSTDHYDATSCYKVEVVDRADPKNVARILVDAADALSARMRAVKLAKQPPHRMVSPIADEARAQALLPGEADMARGEVQAARCRTTDCKNTLVLGLETRGWCGSCWSERRPQYICRGKGCTKLVAEDSQSGLCRNCALRARLAS